MRTVGRADMNAIGVPYRFRRQAVPRRLSRDLGDWPIHVGYVPPSPWRRIVGWALAALALLALVANWYGLYVLLWAAGQEGK